MADAIPVSDRPGQLQEQLEGKKIRTVMFTSDPRAGLQAQMAITLVMEDDTWVTLFAVPAGFEVGQDPFEERENQPVLVWSAV